MSAPFGGHPTLGQYIAWARTQGCVVQQGYTTDEKGRAHSVTKIIDPTGKRWVIEVGTQHSEFLVPTQVGRFDRRLGLTSQWFGINDPFDVDDTPKH